MRCFLIFALANAIFSPVICRDHPKMRRHKNSGVSRRDDVVDRVRRIMDEDSTRPIHDDILQQGKYFQDIFVEHLEPLKIQFGHVCENPDEWEQRFERKDIKNNKHQGKVRWGNKNEEYGEHYWDLNHGQ